MGSINCKLKNITDFTYDEILVDSYGYCSMFDRITVRTGDKYFFVDHDGKQIGATYDGAAMVAANDGYAAVKVGRNGDLRCQGRVGHPAAI